MDNDAPPATSSADAKHPERHYDPVARAQRHLDWLKMRLQITPEQQQVADKRLLSFRHRHRA
jgi:hypothetical protein